MRMTSITINCTIGHCDNGIDSTGMKDPNDKKTDDTRLQLERFVSRDNADVNVFSSSFLKV